MRRGLFQRLRSDERGVSAVEFALIAPLLIFFYMGLAELCQGYMAQKRMGHASAMVADLVAQEESVTAAEVDDIFQIGRLVMQPFSSDTLRQRVSSVTRVNGVARVDWSRGGGMDALEPGSTVTLPQDLIGNGESVIMSEATYDYDSLADYFLEGMTLFQHRYFLRPRVTERTACGNC